MAKPAKTDRQAVIDEMRKKQKSAERRRGIVIVGVCVADRAAHRRRRGLPTGQGLVGGARVRRPRARATIGPRRRSARRSPPRRPTATRTTCRPDTAGRLRGRAAGVRPALERGRRRAGAVRRASSTPTDDRPTLEALVHNLEHGYTILWYDETIADDDDADRRASRRSPTSSPATTTSATSSSPRRGRPTTRTARRSPTASTSRSPTGPPAATARPTPASRSASGSTARR